MSHHPIAPQAQRPSSQHQVSHMMHSYAHSPLARSSADLHEGVTHEYEPDVDADGFRHPGNHHAEHHGEYSPGSAARPPSKSGRPKSSARRFRPSVNDDSKPNSFTFEHEPDVDGDGVRHHHENLSSPAMRALQDVVVPLDPRAGRIVITPSPSLKPNYSPYRHIDDIPNRSIEDLQDPEELHSHANMIYGIDEARASKYSVPDWQEGEAIDYIEEASHGELHPPTVSERPVATKLPIEPTGEVMAPVGNISGDRKPVGPTRTMKEEESAGIDGAYTVDGEGSAGLPFDANMERNGKEGEIDVHEDGGVVPQDMINSTETIRAPRKMSSIATSIVAPEKPALGTPGPVEDIQLPSEKALSQDGSAMTVTEGVKDERPDWLRAAEMMANNEYDRLSKEHLITDERASRESIDFASAARATLLRDHKIERGSSYPSFTEMEKADTTSADIPHGDRQGVSGLPEKDLGGANPPVGSSAREDKFKVETETPSFKAKDDVEPATASKFLGLSSAAAVGASVPAAALMTSSRDAKSGSTGENQLGELVGGDESTRAELATDTALDGEENAAQKSQPAVPRRPQKASESADSRTTPSVPARPSKDNNTAPTTTTTTTNKTAPVVPRRPASSLGSKETPAIPDRPRKTNTAPQEVNVQAPVPTKPSVPARPIPGKFAGKSAFVSALEAKLKGGPPAPKKPEEPPAEAEKSVEEQSAKPLADARKGRARGPPKRKPVVATSEPGTETTDRAASPVCEIGGTFTSRFGVEMRSMSCQTGVIKISSPAGKMTVLEGAGTDYVGQTVVVDEPGQQTAIKQDEQLPELPTNTVSTPASKQETAEEEPAGTEPSLEPKEETRKEKSDDEEDLRDAKLANLKAELEVEES